MSDARRSEQAHSQHLQGDLPPGDMPIRAVAAAVHLPPSLPPMPASQHPPAAPHGDGPVTKALILLDAFANAAEPLRFSQLMERLPFPKATLHRMLKSLTDERMLSFSPQHGTYQLGPRLIRLAHAAWANGSLVDAARPVLDGLHAQLGKTIHLAQLDDGQVLYLDKRVGARGMAMYSRAGKIGPAYCTGVGKAMLAFLPPAALEASLLRQSFSRYTPTTLTSRASLLRELDAVRGRGHAFDREEHEPGIICIAVPILAADGALFGGLSATGPGSIDDIMQLESLAPTLKQAANDIAAHATIRMAPTLS